MKSETIFGLMGDDRLMTGDRLPLSRRLFMIFLVCCIVSLFSVICFISSVLGHCWLGDRKGIWPVQKLGVGLLGVAI